MTLSSQTTEASLIASQALSLSDGFVRMNRETRIFKKLFLIAIAAPPVARCRVVAALVLRNNILAVGIASYNSSKLARKFQSHAMRLFNHAEIAAIKNYISMYGLKNLNKCTLYVCRAKHPDSKWIYGCAKPCKGCLLAINSFGIKDVKWTK